jgi:hypothetical protein
VSNIHTYMMRDNWNKCLLRDPILYTMIINVSQQISIVENHVWKSINIRVHIISNISYGILSKGISKTLIFALWVNLYHIKPPFKALFKLFGTLVGKFILISMWENDMHKYIFYCLEI